MQFSVSTYEIYKITALNKTRRLSFTRSACHASTSIVSKIINGETLLYTYNFLYAKKILVSSIDSQLCPCSPHIAPPVVNGRSATMKNDFFLRSFCRWQHYISRGTIIIVFGTSEQCGCLVQTLLCVPRFL